MKKIPPLAACLALFATLPAAAEIPLQAVRVSPPVELRSGEQTRALKEGDAVDESDRVVTGTGGRISLKFAEVSTITLGDNAELYIHSADPPDLGQGPVMRLQLDRGDLQLDARSGEGELPQDFRLNAGALSIRVLGGHIWATTDAKGETLCLLHGSTEISMGEAHYRLDNVNDCLGHRSDTQEVQTVSSTPQAIEALLARTAFDAEPGARRAALPAHLAMNGGAAPPATPPAKPASAAPATNPTVTAAPAGGWGVVVASLEPAAAAKLKSRLDRENLQVSLQASTADPSRQQVVVGHYKTADEARRHVTTLKKRFKGAWITPRRSD